MTINEFIRAEAQFTRKGRKPRASKQQSFSLFHSLHLLLFKTTPPFIPSTAVLSKQVNISLRLSKYKVSMWIDKQYIFRIFSRLRNFYNKLVSICFLLSLFSFFSKCQLRFKSKKLCLHNRTPENQIKLCFRNFFLHGLFSRKIKTERETKS